MTRETKLGIAFIGILVTVFTGLLVKKLTRPSNRALNPAAQGANDLAAAPRPVQPTTLTPRSESTKPSILAASDERPNSTSPDWTKSSRYGSDYSSGDSARSTTTDVPPAVLGATPIPINDIGNRYGAPQTESINDRYAGNAADASAGALPYRSGYGADGDLPATSGGSVPGTAAPIAQAEPHTAKDNSLYGAYQSPAASEVQASDYRKPSAKSSISAGSSTSAGTALPAAASQTSTGSWDRSTLTGTAMPPAYSSSTAYPSSTASSSSTGATPAHTAGTSYGSATSTSAAAAVSPYAPSAARQSVSSSTPVGSSAWTHAGTSAQAQMYPPANTVTALGPEPIAATVNREGDKYQVQPGDSFWTISEKAYGNGAYFKALIELNRKQLKNRDELSVGQTITVPDEAVLRRKYPDLSPKPRAVVASAQQRLVSASGRMRGPGKIYVVAEGDTLFEIARHELGKASRWGEIYELNRELLGNDFDYLRPGTELVLPTAGGRAAETAARPPESLYSR